MATLVRAFASLALVVLALEAQPAAAQGYPERLIRLVVGVTAGSGADLSGRILASGLEAELGQRVIVDNRPGADGVIAVRQVVTASPDGHTLLYGLGSQVAINPALYATLPYDPKRDLVPVSLVARQPMLVAVHPSLPVKTLGALADYTRANPGTVNYGAGTSTFMLATEALKQRTGADMQHIPFNGNGPAVAALVGGTVQVAVAAATTMLGHAQSGAIRVLAVSGTSRLPQLPDVPSFAEAGMENDVPVWIGVFAPAGTQAVVVDRLHAAIVRTLGTPFVRDRFLATGDILVASTPDELAATMAQDTERMNALVRRIGLAPR